MNSTGGTSDKSRKMIEESEVSSEDSWGFLDRALNSPMRDPRESTPARQGEGEVTIVTDGPTEEQGEEILSESIKEEGDTTLGFVQKRKLQSGKRI